MLLGDIALDHVESILDLGSSLQAVRLGGRLGHDTSMIGHVRLKHVAHLFVAVHCRELMMIQTILGAQTTLGGELEAC